MKSEKNILIAFILNLSFSVFELFGGIFTNSVAIISDSVHDLADAVSIGISWFLEKKSKKQPDETYTYGYLRYSVTGSVITTVILLLGSILVIVNGLNRVIHPQDIHYNGMIVFAAVGVAINLLAAYVTRHGDSLNQKAVNLHMLEDVLGWAVVLVGAILMRFTDWKRIDPILSIGVAVYILVHAFSHLKEALDLFHVKIPGEISVEKIKHSLMQIEGVQDIHHIHIWSMDGHNHYATMHVVTGGDAHHMKETLRHALKSLGIGHVTLELEAPDEHCHEPHCHVDTEKHCDHHHHH